MKHINLLHRVLLALALCATVNVAYAAKTFGENDFIDNFSGKSKKLVQDKLGKPFKVQQSVKPSNASNMVAGMGQPQKDSKPVKVEMWYYKNLVKYDNKHTYKETEITFVNDRVMNIGFFNNR